MELVLILTKPAILLESDMLGILIAAYILLLSIWFVSFLNIYSVDKYEFLRNEQKCIEFKHNMFFIIMYSKAKHIVSKKTFIMEIIGYFVLIALLAMFACSLKLEITTSYILLGIITFIVVVFGCITGGMYANVKRAGPTHNSSKK